jgi:regulator of protease activity HflC (stomatin/prohibitin superfamily)
MASFLYWVVLLLAITIILSLKTLREDERLVIIRLGRFFKIAGPGIVVILPWVDRGIRVNLNRDLPGWQGLSKIELEEKIKASVLSKPR